MDVTVTIEAMLCPEAGGGFSAVVPALPGCVTEGDTPEEVRANLRESIEGWLLAKRDQLASRPGSLA